MADDRSVFVSVCLILLLFVTMACGEDPGPVFELCGAANFDVRNLTNTEWQFPLPNEHCLKPRNTSLTPACQVTMTFCQALGKTPGCENSAVCESYEKFPPYNLASYKNFTNPYNTSGLVSGIGFTTSYQNGEEYTKEDNTTCTLTTVMTFVCNMTASWDKARLPVVNTVPVVPDVHFTDLGNQFCTYNLTFDFAGACPLIVPSHQARQMSPGTILLMIFIVSVILYIAFGCFFNMARGKMGRDACPHPIFWTMLFVYIQDGIQFTLSCGGTRPSPTYESI